MTNTTASKSFLVGAGLSAIAAIVVHSILYSQHLELNFGSATGQLSCDINSTFSCSAVAASRYSSLFGIPVALWGFIANFAFLILLGLWPFTDTESKPAARRNLLIVSGFIAVTSIVMGGISSFLIGKACIYCMAAYALSFVMFLCTYLGTRGIPAAKGFSFGDVKILVILAVVGAFGAMVADDSIKRGQNFDQVEKAVASYVGAWKATPPTTVASVEPLVKGPSADKAKMTVVEFADFRCSHCKHAAPSMKAFAEAHPDVRFEFQAWPLDGECNTSIKESNGVSCLLARVVWCAEKNGGFGWAMHDAIFAREEPFLTAESVTTAIPDLAKGTSLDPAAVKACTDSDEMKAMIRKMADVGTSLSLRGTPTIYVNGRILSGGQLPPVLGAAYREATK